MKTEAVSINGNERNYYPSISFNPEFHSQIPHKFASQLFARFHATITCNNLFISWVKNRAGARPASKPGINLKKCRNLHDEPISQSPINTFHRGISIKISPIFLLARKIRQTPRVAAAATPSAIARIIPFRSYRHPPFSPFSGYHRWKVTRKTSSASPNTDELANSISEITRQAKRDFPWSIPFSFPAFPREADLWENIYRIWTCFPLSTLWDTTLRKIK